ncbi:hypothetical protein [Rhodanobacter sp. MP7CTX1]|uniref:hypothetical protein n=1 Tax=Rhodanobacter sp. MP7CTX1 TaxID=2723084 RepID=UPI00160E04AD|nr:hypothetical protein [Rhodanobacter sp. MP7CTX1]MBB6187945.1 hypothetical protein [Rhodanobacter sp. MP7CTX1]
MGVISEDHLEKVAGYASILLAVHERSKNHKIALAKVLEIPTQAFGFKQIGDETLKSGSSDWPSWAAAMGTRTLAKAKRNQTLKYFARASPLNHFIAEGVINVP